MRDKYTVMLKIKYLILPLAFFSLSLSGEISNLDEVYNNSYPTIVNNSEVPENNETQTSAALRPPTRSTQADKVCDIYVEYLRPDCKDAFEQMYLATGGNCEKALCAYDRCVDGDSFALGEKKCNPVPISSSEPLLFFVLFYAAWRFFSGKSTKKNKKE